MIFDGPGQKPEPKPGFFKKFLKNYPLLYFFVVGIGGAAIIVAAWEFPVRYFLGPQAAERLCLIPVMLGVLWVVSHYFKVGYTH